MRGDSVAKESPPPQDTPPPLRINDVFVDNPSNTPLLPRFDLYDSSYLQLDPSFTTQTDIYDPEDLEDVDFMARTFTLEYDIEMETMKRILRWDVWVRSMYKKKGN